MIEYPHKRIFGLLGAPRAGKDSVAKYLQESRDFVSMAFADKIKEEYGLNKGDFEAAKISGQIEELRKELWDFSASKKKDDPLYFIRQVLKEAYGYHKQVVITDIRTPEELDAFFLYDNKNCIRRTYIISRDYLNEDFSRKDGLLFGSKIDKNIMYKYKKLDWMIDIKNKYDSLYHFMRYLDNFFFNEDIIDLANQQTDTWWRLTISKYVSQFNVNERMTQ